MLNFGLIGYPLGHSFSKKYFEKKFTELKTEGTFKNFEVPDIDSFFSKTDIAKYSGFSVTIPFKEQIISYLDELDSSAEITLNVNSIKVIKRNGKIILRGYNTDIFGFEQSIRPLIKNNHKKALILGSGGSSKSVRYVLSKLKKDYLIVSRNPSGNKQIGYDDVDGNIIEDHKLIINTTPLGMAPQKNKCPPLPYDKITDEHLLFDLVYNPKETLFLKKGKKQYANIKNGLDMLKFQADRSWEIWMDSNR